MYLKWQYICVQIALFGLNAMASGETRIYMKGEKLVEVQFESIPGKKSIVDLTDTVELEAQINALASHPKVAIINYRQSKSTQPLSFPIELESLLRLAKESYPGKNINELHSRNCSLVEYIISKQSIHIQSKAELDVLGKDSQKQAVKE